MELGVRFRAGFELLVGWISVAFEIWSITKNGAPGLYVSSYLNLFFLLSSFVFCVVFLALL